MIDTIAVIFGMTFVGIILICLVWTIISYILNNQEPSVKRNKNLIDNIRKLKQ